MDLCIYCAFSVRPRQEGLQCDGCSRWQHRTCHTGISQAQYRAAVQAEEPIDWSCDQCKNATASLHEYPPNLESTRVDEEHEDSNLEASGELLFSDQETFGECFYKIRYRN